MERGQTRTPVRRARRYPVALQVEVTDLDSEKHLQERTTDLAVFGCGVATRHSFSVGTKVRIRITHRGSNFTALGRVVYVRPDREIGIAFTHMEENDEATLEKWISELRDKK